MDLALSKEEIREEIKESGPLLDVPLISIFRYMAWIRGVSHSVPSMVIGQGLIERLLLFLNHFGFFLLEDVIPLISNGGDCREDQQISIRGEMN